MSEKAFENLVSHPATTEELHKQVAVKIAFSGRHVLLSFPQDLSRDELLWFISWLAGIFPGELSKIQGLSGKIVVAGKLPT